MATMTVTRSTVEHAAQPERRLRTVLGLNATTSLLTGVTGLAAAGWWSDRLGIDSPGWTRVVSAGLVLFALAVALVARTPPGQLRRLAAVVSVADLAWVAGTIGVIAAGALNGTGVVVAIVLGIGVADLALLQMWFRRLMARP